MGIEHLTILTCDRCKRESRYDPHGDRSWRSDWAEHWSEQLTPFGEAPIYRNLATRLVCIDCLSQAEREQLADSRLPLDEEAFPF